MPPSTEEVDEVEHEALGESSSLGAGEKEEPNAIYTCKFPGCDRQYASTDGAHRGTVSCLAESLLSLGWRHYPPPSGQRGVAGVSSSDLPCHGVGSSDLL